MVLVGAWLGAAVGRKLPKHHLDAESKDMVKLGIGFLATLAALVLGLLIASAKSSFDTKSQEIQRAPAKIVLLDRNLRQYGSGADPARELLRRLVTSRANLTSIESELQAADATPGAKPPIVAIEDVQDQIRALTPADETQRLLKARSLGLSEDFVQTRWLFFEQSAGTIPMPFIVVLIVWLAAIAGCLSLFAPRTGTLMAVTVVCGLSFASAIFLILEMDRPFEGVLHISDIPLRNAVIYLNRPAP